MTLSELRKVVVVKGRRNRVPGTRAMEKTRTYPVTSEKIGEDTEITVYHNGYIIYRRGDEKTVFPVNCCYEDYTERDAHGNATVIPYQEFADRPWEMRAFLEGEDRLVHNDRNSRNYQEVLSLNAAPNGAAFNILDSDHGASDPLRLLVEEEVKEEEIRKLHIALSKLTDMQRFVLMQTVVEGRMQVDVAEELGITRAGVSDTLRKALRKLRKYYGISNGSFSTNHFYRKGKAGSMHGNP